MDTRQIQEKVLRESGLVLDKQSIDMVKAFICQGWDLLVAVNCVQVNIAIVFHKEMTRAGLEVLHYQLGGYKFGNPRSVELVGLYFVKGIKR